MAYVALVKALYDYAAQDEDELTLTEDATLYVLEADDPEWWKAKLRRLNPDGTPVQDQTDEEADSLVGLVPANYVEEAEPLRLSRALYDYEAQTEDELTIAEDELLRIYETDGLWLLVKKQGEDPLSGGEGRLGYVPANYVDEAEAVDTGAAPVVEDGPIEAEEEEEDADESYAAVTPAAMPRISMLPSASGKGDEIKMWPVSALDSKKKKKKGTLGIGNASLFFASESDKTPVQKISILHIADYTLEKGKNLHLELSPDSGAAETSLDFHTGSKDAGSEIVKKIESSQAAATAEASAAEAETAVPAAPAAPPAPTPPAATAAFLPPPMRTASGNLPPPVRKTVSFQQQQAAEASEAAAVGAGGEEHAIALYDFEAQGDDELSVAENEALVVLEKENDDWWKVKNAQGQEGVVPASYVELTEGGAAGVAGASNDGAAEEEERQRREEEEAAAAAAAATAAERQRRAAEAAAERRRQEAEERAAREAEEQSRREALKAQPAPEPPKLTQRPSTTEVNRAARNVAIPQGRSAPERPKEGGSSKSRPKPTKTRVWNDRTGQFKVEAEFLGFNQGKLRLHKMNGVVIEVAIEKMSDADIQWLEGVTGKKLMPSESELSRRRESSRAQSQSSSAHRSDRDRERERERRREKEREQRRREAGHSSGPKRNVDWFEFFLAAGVDVDDCTRYAAAFERDKIDETVIADLEPGTLRSLGLREGDIIRVTKFIDRKYRRQKQSTSKSAGGASASTAADLEKQIRADEELARKLQEQEGGPQRGSTVSPPPPQLFSGPDGTLKNNTRRGRPTPKTGTGSVDAASLAAASESLARSTTASPPGRVNTVSPAIRRSGSTQPATANGFDDDAWTPRPPSTKPATPAAAPPAPTPPPAPAAAPAAPAAASPAAASPAPAPAASPQPLADPNSALFEKLAAMRPPSAAAASPRPGATPTGQNSFLGGNQFNPNAPRGPFAPVPANQGLLQPLIPTSGTGQFVPTKMQSQPTGMMGMQMTGMQPQQTGFMGMQPQQQQQPQMTGFGGGSGFGNMNGMGGMGGMQSQPTGFVGMNGGMGSGFSSPSQFGGPMGMQQTGFGAMQPQQTGFMGMQPHQQQQQQPQQTGFGGFGQQQPPQQQQQQQNDGDKFNASNIFNQMKTGQFAQDPNSQAQSAQKYDALRPQPTGFQPGGVMQPQFTGMNFGQQQQQGGYQQGGYNGYGGF